MLGLIFLYLNFKRSRHDINSFMYSMSLKHRSSSNIKDMLFLGSSWKNFPVFKTSLSGNPRWKLLVSLWRYVIHCSVILSLCRPYSSLWMKFFSLFYIKIGLQLFLYGLIETYKSSFQNSQRQPPTPSHEVWLDVLFLGAS